MPLYDYVCKECKKAFTLAMTVTEHEKGKVSCPKCKSRKVEQRVAAFFAVTARKS